MMRKKRHIHDPFLQSSSGERPPDEAGGVGGLVATVGMAEGLLRASPDVGCNDVRACLYTDARRQRDEGSLFTCEHLTLEIWNVDSGLATFTSAWSGTHVEVQLLRFLKLRRRRKKRWFLHQSSIGRGPTTTKCDIYADLCFCGASCSYWKMSHPGTVIHNSAINSCMFKQINT